MKLWVSYEAETTSDKNKFGFIIFDDMTGPRNYADFIRIQKKTTEWVKDYLNGTLYVYRVTVLNWKELDD